MPRTSSPFCFLAESPISFSCARNCLVFMSHLLPARRHGVLCFDLLRHLGHFFRRQIPRLFALRSTIGNGGGEGVELARAGSAPQTRFAAKLVEFPGGKHALSERRDPLAIHQVFCAWVRLWLC